MLLLSLLGMAYLTAYLDRNKTLVESTVSRALGRVVRIDDGITLSWSMTPAVSLHGLWIGNPAWASGKYFARADQASLQFDIPALLRWRLSGA